MSKLNQFTKNLGGGKIISLDSGEKIFKLDSFENNPVVKPQDLGLTWQEDGELKIGAVFNAGAEIFQDKIMLMPRCHTNYRKGKFFDEKIKTERTILENYISEILPLASSDGIHFDRFNNVVIKGDGTDHSDFTYGIEDIRIIKYDERYLLIGCGKIKPPFKGSNADRIAVYSTENFVEITYYGIVKPFDSRNAIPFPELINGKQYMLFRFHPDIHLDYLEAGIDQLLNPSRYDKQWEKLYARRTQTSLIKAGDYPHEKEKVGPGTQLIKTDKGWLLIYHAVGEIDEKICKVYGLPDRIERGYSISAALLDLDNPSKILARTRHPLYIPSLPYELYGNAQYPVDVPAVVFPVGAFVLNNKLIIYAGAGDKYIIGLSCDFDKMVDYLWNYSRCVEV